MIRQGRSLAPLFVMLSVSGCTLYSGTVNTLGPSKPVSDLRPQTAVESLVLSTTPPPFCPAGEVYMVMPEDGRVGVVTVTLNSGEQYQLEGDYSAMSLNGDQVRTYTGNEEELRATFGEAYDAVPAAPLYSMVYFKFATDELTPESRELAKQIYSAVLERSAPEVLVTGHTDTSGPADLNLRLSKDRAEAVKRDLVKLGIELQTIKTFAKGETELLIDTPDNTREPRNRRVEINVR
ncbi:hypothetical protein GCM10011352_29870 [Marinobacterium zhoushanense]|uniref:OmpA-like domain-containing protein n=1 Tax=Marinobacterium zhoushanense TaxID=1679163 RepID=A0ABQ1KMW0_9GAMM|nr:OmpA family protein [Marinobacterium zhoushanense]GGC01743.1 hypothetical protein GCM10011352_29870 [Marinobacterium zhoushanense]